MLNTHDRSRRNVCATLTGLCVLAVAVTGGCAYKRDTQSMALVQQGEYGRAREVSLALASKKPDDRSYMLDRAKVLSLALADGVPEAAEPVADRMYDFLRTQGVNADKGFASFFVGEGSSRVWKGEPFEQAMSLAYIGILDGSRGSWGNLRASVGNSLFQLRDLSKAVAAGETAAKAKFSDDPQAAEREKVIAAAAQTESTGTDDGTSSTSGYESFEQYVTPTPSDFELGYLLKMIAARRLGTGEEAELEAQLLKIAPRLSDVSRVIRTGEYNMVIVADYGLAPEKYGTGMDRAIAAYRATTASSTSPLVVLASGQRQEYPVATDLNRLATDLKWNNLEDMRRAKSAIGTGLLVGGAVVATAGGSRDAAIIGLLMMAGGAMMKATAAADTRHIEVFPQRSYVALLNLREETSTIEVAVDGDPGSRMVLAGVPRPPTGEVLLRYVRLAPNQGAWATSGQVFYASDAYPTAPSGANYPWILGGRCTRIPSEEVLSDYQRAGFLPGMNLSDLVELYREEGISIAGYARPEEGEIGRHILEGGNWLYTPQIATAGFARLYGAERPPYTPKSKRAAELAANPRSQAAPTPSSPASEAAPTAAAPAAESGATN